jgi:acetyltransferase-like isoleucine patch superfamily enzyme
MFEIFYRLFRYFCVYFEKFISKFFSQILFLGNGVKFTSFKTNGYPYIMISRGGIMEVGSNFKMNNTLKANPIGRTQRCSFFVDKDAFLKIGSNVGMSSAAIVCHTKIEIHDNVKIGGGTCIYDTDFHAIDSEIRKNNKLDKISKKVKPVLIKENVFIGAHTTILKGVTIGKNSVIGACSVVTKNIPSNEIWAGNPAKFIKKI